MRARCLPLLLMLLSPAALALEVKDVDPHVIATVLPGEPPRLRLSWQPMADVASFSVLRRAPGAPAWDAPLEGALPGDTTSFVDGEIGPGQSYEQTGNSRRLSRSRSPHQVWPSGRTS